MCCFASGFGQTITIADGSEDEDSGTIMLTATLDIATLGGFTVDVSTNDGSATILDNDYTAIVSQTLNFLGNAGETQTFDVIPTSDTTVEADETLTITMDNLQVLVPVDIVVIADIAIVTITNDDTATVSINDPTPVLEGDALTATLNFAVSIDQSDPTTAITLDYTVSGGNENGTTLPLTFAAGATGAALIQTVSVTTNGDTVIEPDEAIAVTLGNPSANATISVIDGIGASSFLNDDVCAAGTTAPPINGDPTSFCDSSSINLNNFVVGGTGSAPPNSTLRWSTVPNPTLDSDFIPTSVVTTSDTFFAVYWDDLNDCASDSSPVSIAFNSTPNIDADDVTTACSNSSTIFGATTVNLDDFSAGSDTGNWVFTSGPTSIAPDGSNIVQFSNQADGTYVYTYTTNTANAPCTDQSFTVTITVADCDPCVAGTTAPLINTTTPTVFCDAINVSLNDYTTSTPPTGTTLEWSRVSDPESPTAIRLTPTQIANPNPGTVYGFFWDTVNSCASPTLEITIVLNMPPVITATTGNSSCGTGSVELTVAGNTPGAVQPPTFNWYNAPTGGSILFTGPSFTTTITTTTSFYVEAIANQCTSSRVEVIATVNEQPMGGIELNAVSCNVAAGGLTITDLDNTIIENDIANYTGVWTVATDPSGAIVIDPENNVDFEGLVDGDYIFTFSTTNVQAPCTNIAVNVIISVTDCNPPPTDLSIEKTVDNESPTVGSLATFTITLINLTMGRVTNVEINELVNETSGFRYVSGVASNGTYDENTGIWSLPEIAPNEVNTLEITVRVLNSGNYINIATIASSLPIDSNEDNNEAQITLTPIDGDCGIVYNQFSPNGDGTNDFFSISCIDSYANNSLEVYNRYGNKVFDAKRYDNTWDGTRGSADVPLGTYFYILDLGDGSEVRKGWIQIIR